VSFPPTVGKLGWPSAQVAGPAIVNLGLFGNGINNFVIVRFA
jgi:hypothetical protein